MEDGRCDSDARYLGYCQLYADLKVSTLWGTGSHTSYHDLCESNSQKLYEISKKECESLAPEESNREMRRNAEISNRVTIIGKVCTPPTLFITDKGQRIANYQLDVMRKYRIKEDQETNKHDFPFVKSYGVVADNDVLAIQEGGMVFVDGAIQTREYLKNHQCPTCGETYQYKDTATEIVPYSTEYLTGCKTMEEIEEIKQQRAIEEGKLARAEIFGEDDNLDADDVDVDE